VLLLSALGLWWLSAAPWHFCIWSSRHSPKHGLTLCSNQWNRGQGSVWRNTVWKSFLKPPTAPKWCLMRGGQILSLLDLNRRNALEICLRGVICIYLKPLHFPSSVYRLCVRWLWTCLQKALLHQTVVTDSLSKGHCLSHPPPNGNFPRRR
jgi:hypothetical protein